MSGHLQQGRVMCETIRIVEVNLATKPAWQELHKAILYKCQVLLEAVNALRANNLDNNEGRQDSDYEDVCTWISDDEKFVRIIGKWVRLISRSRTFYIQFPCPLGH